MEVIRSVATMKEWVGREKRAGARLAFVPTMGFLHEGHLSLVREAKKRATRVVASIFVNPLQFGREEDLAKYPRDFEGDAEKLRAVGADLLFAPSTEELYGKGFQSRVELSEISQGLCGAFRPGHFNGVATVVAVLFHIVQPEIAIFGEKDYQQLQVIRRMVKDLHFPIQIVGMPTIRAKDGLALSSRNTYLNVSEREMALAIPKVLEKFAAKTSLGSWPTKALCEEVHTELATGGLKVQYVEIVHPDDLKPLEKIGDGNVGVLAIAAYAGGVRLIDNCFLGGSREVGS